MSAATMDAPKVTSLEQMSKLLTDLPAVREQFLQRRKEIETARKKQVAALAKVRSERNGAAVAALGVAHERALAAEKVAEDALANARDARMAAFNAITEHTMQCDLDIQRAELALFETADPAIGNFLEWAFAELWDERKNGRRGYAQLNGHDPVTEKERPATLYNNEESHQRRLAAIQTAIAAAEQLRFVLEADVGEELAKIRASIPARDMSTHRVD